MTPLVTRVALDPDEPGTGDHRWRMATRPDLDGRPHETAPSAQLVAWGFRERMPPGETQLMVVQPACFKRGGWRAER